MILDLNLNLGPISAITTMVQAEKASIKIFQLFKTGRDMFRRTRWAQSVMVALFTNSQGAETGA